MKIWLHYLENNLHYENICVVRQNSENNEKTDRTFSYIYSHPNSYEPPAQVCTDNNHTQTRYFHCDQIGAPQELTDENGNLCWYGDYLGWGKLRNSHNLMADAHQPFRLQNQYADEETGLHYNFFRYYDPHIGRFTQQDPIGLAGGMNLYRFEGTVQNQVDPLGLFAPALAAPWILEALAYATTAMTGILIGVGIMDAMEESEDSSGIEQVDSTESQLTTDISNCSKTESGCPPCNPYPVGTLGYIGPRIVQRGADGARNNDGIEIPHFKVFAVQQNPKDCTCRWQQTQKVMQIYGHHTKFIPSGAIDLNGKGDPPSYP